MTSALYALAALLVIVGACSEDMPALALIGVLVFGLAEYLNRRA